VSKKISLLSALVFIALFVVPSALAQTVAPVRLGGLNISEFPKIITYADIRSPQGFFLSGLPSNAATVFEDEQPIPAILTEVRPGAQIVVAYGGGGSFGIINQEVRTRFDALRGWLLTWSTTQIEPDLDTLSLVVPEGVVVNHEVDPQLWIEGLQNYVPNFNQPPNPLETLSAAIDNALDPLAREGVGRTVLFLTQGIPEEQQAALQSQIDRATQAGVRVHIGFINSSSLFEGSDAVRLQAAAFQTGGLYFAFSNDEPLPDLNQMFESSRRAYLLEYRSQINTPGTHTITVMVNSDSGELLSNTISFEANLMPPAPVFVGLPAQIVRVYPPESDVTPENLTPSSQTIEVLTEFPDSIPRQISQLNLYVNDTLAAERTEAPFDNIELDLSPYAATEILELRLEVVDELGMTGSSLTLPLEVIIFEPEGGFFSSLGRNVPWIIGGVVALSGAVLFLVLVLAGRLRPRRIGELRQRRKAAADPVTSPVRDRKTKSEPLQPTVLERLSQRLPAAARIQWPSRTRPITDPYGHLVRVSEDGEPKTESMFPITVLELTFGSDSRQAVILLDDPAVAPVHARLWRDDQGDFFIEDYDTVSGTYHNYLPVKENGSRLEHGDLIHIATTGFRFTSSKPNRLRKPTATPLSDNGKES
jgi:hypothetical protein